MTKSKQSGIQDDEIVAALHTLGEDPTADRVLAISALLKGEVLDGTLDRVGELQKLVSNARQTIDLGSAENPRLQVGAAWPEGATVKLESQTIYGTKTGSVQWAYRDASGQLMSLVSRMPLDPLRYSVVDERKRETSIEHNDVRAVSTSKLQEEKLIEPEMPNQTVILEKALEAFWSEYCDQVPEVVSGDSQITTEDLGALHLLVYGVDGPYSPVGEVGVVPDWIEDERVDSIVAAALAAAEKVLRDANIAITDVQEIRSEVTRRLTHCVDHVLHYNPPPSLVREIDEEFADDDDLSL